MDAGRFPRCVDLVSVDRYGEVSVMCCSRERRTRWIQESFRVVLFSWRTGDERKGRSGCVKMVGGKFRKSQEGRRLEGFCRKKFYQYRFF